VISCISGGNHFMLGGRWRTQKNNSRYKLGAKGEHKRFTFSDKWWRTTKRRRSNSVYHQISPRVKTEIFLKKFQNFMISFFFYSFFPFYFLFVVHFFHSFFNFWLFFSSFVVWFFWFILSSFFIFFSIIFCLILSFFTNFFNF